MTEYYLFGTYFSLNQNLNSDFTADRAKAKWRSRFSLSNQNAEPVAEENEFYLLDNLVHIVAISDLDYQLRNTEPVGDENRIKRVQGAIRVDRKFYVGRSATLVEAIVESRFTPPTNQEWDNSWTNLSRWTKPRTIPDYLKFAEIRLELGFDYGAVGGMSFSTSINKVRDDREQRNVDRYLPRGRWQLGQRTVADSEPDKLSEFSYLKSFHNDRLGSFEGFRFKDWSDYKATEEIIAIGDGVKTQFQLRKAYAVGEVVVYRPIQKPVSMTVSIFIDDQQLEDFDLDYSTGIINLVEPLQLGATLSANFEFDVPAWFESDEIGFKLNGYQPETGATIYQLESVFVVEGRIPLTLPWDISPLPNITQTLDLGIIYETIEKFSHSTSSVPLKSGYTRREAKRQEQQLFFDLGDRNYDREEVNKILNYFYCARGKASEFPFTNLGRNYQVRFNQDNLNLRFEAENNEDALFNLSSLSLQLKEEVIFKIPPYSIPLDPLFIDPQDRDNPSIKDAGDSFYNGSQGGKAKDATPFNISTYQAESVNFDITIPPGETGSGVSYYAASLFWAGGTLHLLVTTNTTSSVYRNRLIHYSLNQNDGWNFEYQNSSTEQLKNYTVSISNINRASIYKTNTGVSQFFLAGNTVAFGDTAGYTSSTNGLLRFEISEQGEGRVFFVDNEEIAIDWGVPYMVHGDRAWFLKSSPYIEQGTFDSITYFNNAGFPIINTDSNREYQYNIWTNNVAEPDDSEVIYHGSEPILKYFTSFLANPSFYLNSGADGSYLIKALARKVCETGKSGCSSSETVDLVYFFLKSSYNADPVLVDTQKWLNRSTLGDSHYIQTYNSNKSSCDRFGNLLVSAGRTLIFMNAGLGCGINIAGQIGFSANSIKNKPAITPYGFAVLGHSSNLFDSQVHLTFIQTG